MKYIAQRYTLILAKPALYSCSVYWDISIHYYIFIYPPSNAGGQGERLAFSHQGEGEKLV